jgi:hypothetical protein
MGKKLRKYYYKTEIDEGSAMLTESELICIERCLVKNGYYIGSWQCKDCENCIKKATQNKKRYIICKVINKATGKEK